MEKPKKSTSVVLEEIALLYFLSLVTVNFAVFCFLPYCVQLLVITFLDIGDGARDGKVLVTPFVAGSFCWVWTDFVKVIVAQLCKTHSQNQNKVPSLG